MLLRVFLVALLLAPQISRAADTVERLGDAGQYFVPLSALVLDLGYRDKQGFVQFGLSFVTAMAITESLKYGIAARRPNGCSRSFPSGHTTAAFVGASFIQKRYGWGYGVPAYAAAAFVAASRVYAGAHWARDVVAGAVIGYVSATIFTTRYGYPIAIEPIIEKNSLGISLKAEW